MSRVDEEKIRTRFQPVVDELEKAGLTPGKVMPDIEPLIDAIDRVAKKHPDPVVGRAVEKVVGRIWNAEGRQG